AARWEIAPHPYLGNNTDWVKELRTKRSQFPGAVGWRSHSCIFSHMIAEWLAFNGYVYASTVENFGQGGIKPHRNLWGIWQVPIFYMDNLDFSRSRFWPNWRENAFSPSLIQTSLNGDGCCVFDFHPIHLLLNTPNPDFYSHVRDRFQSVEPLAN